jgi:hypothetical protein
VREAGPPFPVPSPLFPLLCSLFAVPYSLFPVPCFLHFLRSKLSSFWVRFSLKKTLSAVFSINPWVRSLYLVSFLHFTAVLRLLRAAFESPSRALCRRSSWVNHHRLPLSQPPVKSKSGGVWVSFGTGRLQKHRSFPRAHVVFHVCASGVLHPELGSAPGLAHTHKKMYTPPPRTANKLSDSVSTAFDLN